MQKLNSNLVFLFCAIAFAIVLLFRKSSAAASSLFGGSQVPSINGSSVAAMGGGGISDTILSVATPSGSLPSQKNITLLVAGTYNDQIYNSDGSLKFKQNTTDNVVGSIDVEFDGVKFKCYRGLGDKLHTVLSEFSAMDKSGYDKSMAKRKDESYSRALRRDVRADWIGKLASKYAVERNLLEYYFNDDALQIWYVPNIYAKQRALLEFIKTKTP